MGTSDKDSEREEIVAWAKQHETKFFLKKIDEEIRATLDRMAGFNSTGETLSRDYYRAQGSVLALQRVPDLIEALAKGEE